MIYVPGHDSFENILSKTIDSVRWCLGHAKYDFIVRTNLSSFWDFRLLLQALEGMPRESLYSGIINWGEYVSGCGIIFSADVCRKLIDMPKESNEADDQAIGTYLRAQNVPMHMGRRYDLTYEEGEQVPTDHYHYRAKTADLSYRYKEPEAIRNLLFNSHPVGVRLPWTHHRMALSVRNELRARKRL